jgi:hypothetical protein
MILPFKYKGYQVELKGEISPLTSQVKFRFSNETDDNSHVLVLNTDKDRKPYNVVNKIKRSVDDRLRYLAQTRP